MSYADVNGLSMYYEEHGEGEPLVLLHGGISGGEIYAPILPELAAGRRVIVVDLQGHGHTGDIDRPLRPAHLAGDVAALADHLGLAQVDLMGYSLGGEVALHVAIQRPELVRRLVLVSIAFRRDGWHAEALAAMDMLSADVAEMMLQSPAAQHHARVNPQPENWRELIGKTAELLKVDYDWSGDVAKLTARTLLVYADADSIAPAHIMEFWGLLGGGLRDPGWDGSQQPVNQLAILPGRTHYDLAAAPGLPATAIGFLDAA